MVAPLTAYICIILTSSFARFACFRYCSLVYAHARGRHLQLSSKCRDLKEFSLPFALRVTSLILHYRTIQTQAITIPAMNNRWINWYSATKRCLWVQWIFYLQKQWEQKWHHHNYANLFMENLELQLLKLESHTSIFGKDLLTISSFCQQAVDSSSMTLWGNSIPPQYVSYNSPMKQVTMKLHS